MSTQMANNTAALVEAEAFFLEVEGAWQVARQEHAGAKQVKIESEEAETHCSSRLEEIDRLIQQVQTEHFEARDQVAAMTKAQLNEVKSLKTNPPAIVRRAMESVWILLRCDQWQKGAGALKNLDLSKEWSKIQRMLTSDDFVKTVVSFDPGRLDKVPWVIDYLVAQYFKHLEESEHMLFELESEVTRSESAPLGSLLLMTSSASSSALPTGAGASGGMVASTSNSSTTRARTLPPSASAKVVAGTPAAAASASTGSITNSNANNNSNNSSNNNSNNNDGGSGAATLLNSSGSAASLSNLAESPFCSTASTGSNVAASPTRSFSLQSAGLSTLNRRSTLPKLGAAPQVSLDIASVARASKASAVLVRWTIKVVAEFLRLRALRAQRTEASQHLEAAKVVTVEKAKEETVAKDKMDVSAKKMEEVWADLARLREEAAAAQDALRQLKRMRAMQDSLVSDSYTVGSQFRGSRSAASSGRSSPANNGRTSPFASSGRSSPFENSSKRGSPGPVIKLSDIFQKDKTTPSSPSKKLSSALAMAQALESEMLPEISEQPPPQEGSYSPEPYGNDDDEDDNDGGGAPSNMIPPKNNFEPIDENENLDDIAVDASAPPRLGVQLKGILQVNEDECLFKDWFIEFDFLEIAVAQRSSKNFKEHNRKCNILCRHLRTNPEYVVLLEGFADMPAESIGLSNLRAQNLAKWLLENGVSPAQIRVSMPEMPNWKARTLLRDFEEQKQQQQQQQKKQQPQPQKEGSNRAKAKPGGGEEDEEQEEQEEEQDEDEDEAEEEDDYDPESEGRPDRSATAKLLRPVRILEGPCGGDAEQKKQPGIFFAPEDADLDSIGESPMRLLRKVARELAQLLALEPERRLLVEGHSDEGIHDVTLLGWLAQNRAESVKSYLIFCAGDPEEEGEAKDNGLLPAAAQEELDAFFKAKKAQKAAEESEEEEEDEEGNKKKKQKLPPPVIIKPEDIVTCNRGKTCMVTSEYGRRGLNRRVELFIV